MYITMRRGKVRTEDNEKRKTKRMLMWRGSTIWWEGFDWQDITTRLMDRAKQTRRVHIECDIRVSNN